MRPILLTLLLPAVCAAQGWQSVYATARPRAALVESEDMTEAEAVRRAEAKVAALERQLAELRESLRGQAQAETPAGRLARLRSLRGRMTLPGRPAGEPMTVGEYLDRGGSPADLKGGKITPEDIAFLDISRYYPPPAQVVPAPTFPAQARPREPARGSIPHNPTHTCPACGTTSPAGTGTWIVRGHLANGEHVHTCPNCGQSWSH